MKEVVQEIVLSGLAKAGFFDIAAFYGGTALRIFHKLDRFSEDLDFSLLVPDGSFSFTPFLSAIGTWVGSYGLRMEIQSRGKSSDSNVRAAVARGNMREMFLYFFPNEDIFRKVPSNEDLKIKLEVDADTPAGLGTNISIDCFHHRMKQGYMIYLPCSPASFMLFWQGPGVQGPKEGISTTISSIFPGVSRLISDHLRERLVASGTIERNEPFSISVLKDMLYGKFREIDYGEARLDVIPFISDPEKLSLWSSDFFCSITDEYLLSV